MQRLQAVPCVAAVVMILGGVAPTPARAQGPEKPLIIEGKLAKDDPRDRVRQKCGHKVHEVKLEAGRCYQIDLASKDFDPFLRLEDDRKKQLAFNDDIDYANKVLDSRLFFAPLETARFRLIVTTYEEAQAGAYTLHVAALPPLGKPVVERRRLTKDDALGQGRHYQIVPLQLKAGSVHVIDAVSKDFTPTLLLRNPVGKPPAGSQEKLQGEGVARLVVHGDQDQECRVLTTSTATGKTGEYTLRRQQYRGPTADLSGARQAVRAANQRGAALYEQGRYAAAAAEYERALALATRAYGPEHLETATPMNNLAEAYRVQSQYGKAEPLFLRSLAIYEKHLGKDHLDVATALNNLAGLHRVQGLPGKAEPLLKRSLEIRESKLGKDHLEVAASLNNLAALCWTQGLLRRAEPLYQRSLQIKEKLLGKHHPSVGITVNNLAVLYKDQGQYGKAEPLFRRSLEIMEKELGEDHPEVATALNGLAGLYQHQGQYGKAEPLYRRLLEIWEQRLGKDHPSVAAALIGLAGLHRDQGQFARAEPLLRRSLAICEQLSKDHPGVAVALNGLAGLYRAQRQYGRAEPLLKRSLQIREKQLGKDHPDVANALNNLALLYLEQRRLDEAEPLYLRSLQIREKQLGQQDPKVAHSLGHLAVVYAAQKRWQAATEATDRARRGLRRHFTRELAALAEADQLAFLRTRATADFCVALSLGWQLRTEAVARRHSAAWLINGQALAQEALATQTLLARDSGGQPWAPLAAELQEVRGQLATLGVQAPRSARLAAHRELLAELSEREQGLARRVAQEGCRGERAAPWLELEQIQKRLADDTALVAVARFDIHNFQASGPAAQWAPARYVAWLIDVKDVHVVDLGEAAALEQDVQALRRVLDGAGAAAAIASEGEPQAEKLLRTHLDKVARRVLHPLLPHLKDRPRWLVCPDGALWLVPWAALTLPDGKYVVERHTVSHLISGRDVIPSEPKSKPSAPVIFANLDYDLQADKPAVALPGRDEQPFALRQVQGLGAVRFTPLPATAVEAKLIAPRLKEYAGAEPRVLTGGAGGESAFKALNAPKVLVLATHGFFLPDVRRQPDDNVLFERPRRAARAEENPLLRSGLALAGANQRETASKRGAEDGILTGLEILGTDLRGTELVVLSACETGLGEVRNGEGVAGLRQAFQLAGAQSVLATLWQIPDRQTAQLMGKFFDHLAAGRGRAEALRLAQLETIRARRQREGAAHPFFWAAFTLTGNWR